MKLLKTIFGFSKFEPREWKCFLPSIPSGGKTMAARTHTHPELIQAIATLHERPNWLIRLYWVLFVAIIVRPFF